MSNNPKLSCIRQIAITVSNVDTALRFYRDVLGLTFLFSAGPELAFLDASGVRLMLSTPQGAGSIGHNSILYFSVSGSTPLTRTLQLSLMMGQEECHAAEKAL